MRAVGIDRIQRFRIWSRSAPEIDNLERQAPRLPVQERRSRRHADLAKMAASHAGNAASQRPSGGSRPFSGSVAIHMTPTASPIETELDEAPDTSGR